MASRLRGRAVVLPTAIVLAVTGGAVAWAQSGPAAAGYRTAVVGRGDVQQTLTLTGTVSVVSQARARFRASGSVSAVRVVVGQTVTAGQLLATMDTGALSDAVIAARAALARAKATLETDSSSSSSASSAPTATPPASAPSQQGSSTAAAQRTAEDALRTASQAVQAAALACASAPSASPSATAATTPTTTPSPSPSSTPTAAAAPKQGAPALDCTTALRQALATQQATAKAQQDLARALLSSTTTPSASSSSSDSSNRPSQGSSTTSTAATITRDTAAVSAAEVALAEAEKDLASVTLTAPIAGTVASIPWTAGGTATPSDAVVLLAAGAVDVVVDVPAASIRSITVGLPASVRSDGASAPVEGTVTAIGLLPTDTSGSSATSSTTTYPVTVRVPSGAAIVDGSSASVTLAVKSVKDVVTVPNSALHGSSVTVVSKGKPTTVRVTTGARGALTTEVTKGLSEGQVVVLADLSEELPTSSTTTNRNRVGGFDGPPIGAFPDGFKGGPPTTVTRG